jgi:alkyl sulfatase BDS1-like metallo-beta-lactamase superfamily hydrolase
MTFDPNIKVSVRSWLSPTFITLLCAALAACGNSDNVPGENTQGFTAPSSYTSLGNRKLASNLPRDDGSDLEAAMRGFIATHEPPQDQVRNQRGEIIWNLNEYDFVKGEAPDSTNPSLWRQASLNNIHGLFKVTDRVYQVRGFDLANMTIIQGDSGLIIVDPLTAEETAAAALALAREHLGNAPVVAVIFTHSHIDHFAGIWGVISREDYKDGKIRVIAPEGFIEEATSENVIAGMKFTWSHRLRAGKDTRLRHHGYSGTY